MRVSLIPSLRRRNDARYGITRALRSVLIATGSLLLAISVIAPAPPAQAANPSDGFNPGNIISDANFYDGRSMSVTEVQQFLNRQVPNCWLGRPGYEIGKPVQWGGPTKLASKCLKDFRINTTTQVADAYCAAIPGIRNESAASVIVRVSQACGISPKVLLVMLDKEQSLVSDPWPNENQYFLAMGYACPDSGPGNTANCDPSRGGFAKQVYRAAWQFKVYKALSNSYRYKPFQNNYIQWHPNASCGGSTVRIENYATAGLYIYTPYRPNQAALNAGWGEGNACSSYGNRNFYNYYKAWFGAPSGPPVAQELVAFYESLGGSSGFLGAPAGTASVYNNGGLGQGFQGGSMYWSKEAGASAVKGAVRAEYWDSGSWSGPLGFPRATETQILGGGVVQQFQGGTIYWSHATGAYHVRGAILTAYVASGATNGPLRFPIGRERSLAGGAMQEFQSGTIYWKHTTGGVPVRGAVRSALLTSGGVEVLGYPVGGEASAPRGGVQQEFEFATVFWTHGSGAHPMRGAMRAAYVAAGGPQSSLLYPTSAESRYATGGAGQGFQSGSMYWHPATGAYPVRAAVRKAFWDAGSISGLGFPLSGEKSTPAGGVEQHFQKGSIYWRHDLGAYPVQGPALSAYQGAKGASGALGFPTAVATGTTDGGSMQRFERGVITVDKSGKARVTVAASSPLERGGEQAAAESPEEPGEEVVPGMSSDREDNEGGIDEEALNEPPAAE